MIETRRTQQQAAKIILNIATTKQKQMIILWIIRYKHTDPPLPKLRDTRMIPYIEERVFSTNYP